MLPYQRESRSGSNMLVWVGRVGGSGGVGVYTVITGLVSVQLDWHWTCQLELSLAKVYFLSCIYIRLKTNLISHHQMIKHIFAIILSFFMNDPAIIKDSYLASQHIRKSARNITDTIWNIFQSPDNFQASLIFLPLSDLPVWLLGHTW